MPSDWLILLLERARETTELMVPPDLMPSSGLAGLILLAAALFSGIFGAYYAKGIMSAILGGLGFAIGSIAGGVFEIDPVLAGLTGLLAFACLGYYTHRLWIGLAVGLLAGTIAMFTYGHDSVWPAFLDYQPNPVLAEDGQVSYELPSGDEQIAYSNPRLLEYFEGFYGHVRDIHPQVTRNTAVIAVLCAFIGFVLGAILTRWALILSCALIGTLLFNLSLVTFAESFAPQGWTANLARHPQAALAFVLTCFVLSILIQFRMTQQTTLPASADKPKS